jgi:diguanylate cyclase (GGDEF)-like protein
VAWEQAKRAADEDADSLGQLRAEVNRLTGELARAQARIAELEARADVDPLLEVLNRRGFERELNRSLAYVRRYGGHVALLYVDLDGFKVINDAHGHAAGDALLKAVAGVLVGRVRTSDMVGRLGGDEFGILMWNIGEPQARAKARELEAEITATQLVYGDLIVAVGASAGLVMLSGEASPASAIDAADRAMYARKRERRGRPQSAHSEGAAAAPRAKTDERGIHNPSL